MNFRIQVLLKLLFAVYSQQYCKIPFLGLKAAASSKLVKTSQNQARPNPVTSFGLCGTLYHLKK